MPVDTPLLDAQLNADGVGVVTLQRPKKRNALSIQLLEAIDAQLENWSGEDAMRCVVITGEGPAFCAGFDITELSDPATRERMVPVSSRYHRRLWSYPKVVVAAINGPALAGGLDLATLCDIRIASEEASFGHPEIKLGAPPLFTPLRWLIGHGRARELCLTGRRMDAKEAAAAGLVSEVVAPAELMDRTIVIATEVAQMPPQAVATAKRYLTRNPGFGFEDSFRVEHDDVFARSLEIGRQGG
jgi:enoyl-CoA hydratase/carnithine racemase